MSLAQELEAAAEAAAPHAAAGEALVAILPAEPEPGRRTYLCSYENGDGGRSWLAVDGAGAPIVDRGLVRTTVSIAALCELAEETAGGGQLDELRQQLVALRLTENPPGLDEAEEAITRLETVLEQPPRVARADYLDRVGGATRELEQALGETAGSPFAAAMQQGMGAVDELVAEVERSYKGELT